MNDSSDQPDAAVEFSNDRPDVPAPGMASMYRLFEAFIALREKNERQHKLFEQTLARLRDTLQDGFNAFAADTQKAYQQMRQELHGDKRIALLLLNELLDFGQELAHIVAAKPQIQLGNEEGEAVKRWIEAVEIQSRKVTTALGRHGIHPYHAVIGSPYDPALHERVGSRRMEGMPPLLIAEEKEQGYASQQPEFVLRRPKVLVSD